MEKDFDYNEFLEFMHSLQDNPNVSFVFLDNQPFAQTQNALNIIDQMEDLEDKVSSRPCYDSIDELLTAVKEM